MELSLQHTSLSCTHYQHGDNLGKMLAYVALAPILVIVFQFSKLYTRREVHEAVLLLGLVAEEAVARTLKHVLKHPRPATCKMLNLCHSHGMPSSHTSMMFCYASITLCLAIRLHSRRGRISKAVSAVEQLACGVLAVAVGWSRVYLGYHSTDQVTAGAMLGVSFGVCWFGIMNILQPLYRWTAQLHMLQLLGVKDTYDCAEPLTVEHAVYRGKIPGKNC